MGNWAAEGGGGGGGGEGGGDEEQDEQKRFIAFAGNHGSSRHPEPTQVWAKEMAADAGVEYKTNNAAEDIFKRARDNGDLNLADLDFSAVFEQIHEDSKGKSEYSAKRQKK
jgi:hypothetical protein